MHYNTLGRSSLSISAISMGCMSLGSDDAENERLIHTAIDHGINYFDTADLYNKGMNEETVGKALRNKRDNVYIATKGGNQWRADGSGWDWNASRDYIIRAAEQSLKRLGVDHIDLYQLHGGTINDPIDETIDAFEILCKQGKIRYYGISSIRPNVIREYVQRSNIASVMMQYSLLDRRPEEEILSLLQQHNIGVLARGTLASGMLVNKPAKPYLSHIETEVAATAQAVQTLSGSGRSATAVAIQYVLGSSAVTSAVVGIRTREQLEQILAAANAPALTAQQAEALAGAIPANRYQEHR